MKTMTLPALLTALFTAVAAPCAAAQAPAEPLVHEAVIGAPVADVWDAFTTKKGVESWMVPRAEVDFRIGGTLKTTYVPGARIGGEHTIVNTILSYEPQRMLSMRCTRAPADFPFKDVIGDTWSVTRFEPLGPGRTRVTIAGYGYTDDPLSRRMRAFFQQGNAQVLEALQARFADDEEPTSDDDRPRIIRKEVIIDAPRTDVWNAWTTEDGVRSFFARYANVDLRFGGPFEMIFSLEPPEGLRGSEGCRILSYVEGEVLSFTWNAPPQFLDVRGERTFVVLQFEDAGPGRTRLTLTHGGWQAGGQWDEVYAYFDDAWTGVLGSLQARFDEGPRWDLDDLGPYDPPDFKMYVYFLRPARDDFMDRSTRTAAENDAMRGHVEHLKRLHARGRIIAAGPSLAPTPGGAGVPPASDGEAGAIRRQTIEPEGPRTIPLGMAPPGIVIFPAIDAEEAQQIMEADPAVADGVFKAQANPFTLAFWQGF